MKKEVVEEKEKEEVAEVEEDEEEEDWEVGRRRRVAAVAQNPNTRSGCALIGSYGPLSRLVLFAFSSQSFCYCV